METKHNVFVTGDLHGEPIQRFSYGHNPWIKDTIQENDIVVCLGDCATVDWPGLEKQCNYNLDWLNDKPWTTILLYGNHDNYDAIQKYPVVNMFDGYVRRVRESVFAVDFPVILNLNENKCLLIPGAESHDVWNLFYPWDKRQIRDCRKREQWYRVVGESWWPQERINVNSCSCLLELENGKCGIHDFDYVLSHDCPGYMHKIWKRKDSLSNAVPTEGEEFLTEIAKRISYKTWWHGHCHEEFFLYGIDKPDTACIYNGIYTIDSLSKYYNEYEL